MPSSQTITTYHTFVADTFASSSQVNTNFSNHRGHSVPINTDSQSASHRTHDIGYTDHFWRDAYIEDIFPGITTSSAKISGDSVGQITIGFPNTTSVVTFENNGIRGRWVGNNNYTSTQNSPGSDLSTSTFITITNLEITMTTFGRPVQILFRENGGATSPSGAFTTESAIGEIRILRVANGVTGTVSQMAFGDQGNGAGIEQWFPVGSFNTIDNGGTILTTSGEPITVSYHVQGRRQNGSGSVYLEQSLMLIHEI